MSTGGAGRSVLVHVDGVGGQIDPIAIGEIGIAQEREFPWLMKDNSVAVHTITRSLACARDGLSR